MTEKNKHTPPCVPRHIIWDWNGTLSDDAQAAVNAVNHLLAERALPTIDLARHREKFDFPVRDYYTALGFRLETEDWDALARRFNDAFHADPSARLFRGTVQTLTRLAAAGIAMSVLSACNETALTAALDRCGIREFFVAVSGLRHNSADSKLALAERHIAALALPPETIYIIGDTTHDAEVAEKHNCKCLLLSTGYQSRERLIGVGVPVLDCVDDVPKYFGL